MEIKKEEGELYCVYCNLTEKEIRKERRVLGYRFSCTHRNTEKGFHRYSYWKKCRYNPKQKLS